MDNDSADSVSEDDSPETENGDDVVQIGDEEKDEEEEEKETEPSTNDSDAVDVYVDSIKDAITTGGDKVSIAATVKEILDSIPANLIEAVFGLLNKDYEKDGLVNQNIPDLEIDPDLPESNPYNPCLYIECVEDVLLPKYPVEPPCESEVVAPHIPVEPIEKPYEVVEPVVVETPCEDEVVSPDVIETAPAGYKPYAVSTPLPEDEDISSILESGASKRNYFLVAISALTLLL
jgi:hypothetical protein